MKSLVSVFCILFGCMVFTSGCGKPLRVGTRGADLYHREDCPSVQRSWDKGYKRVNYYTWLGLELSGRKPDTKVCHAGTRHDPNGLLDPPSSDVTATNAGNAVKPESAKIVKPCQ